MAEKYLGKKYICYYCEEKFYEEEADYKDASFLVPYGSQYVKKEEYAMVCPYCGSDEIDIDYDDEDE